MDAHHDEQLWMERGLYKHVGKLGQLPSVAWCWRLLTSHTAPSCTARRSSSMSEHRLRGTQAYWKGERGGGAGFIGSESRSRCLPDDSFWGCIPTLRGASRDIIPRALWSTERSTLCPSPSVSVSAFLSPSVSSTPYNLHVVRRRPPSADGFTLFRPSETHHVVLHFDRLQSRAHSSPPHRLLPFPRRHAGGRLYATLWARRAHKDLHHR